MKEYLGDSESVLISNSFVAAKCDQGIADFSGKSTYICKLPVVPLISERNLLINALLHCVPCYFSHN